MDPSSADSIVDSLNIPEPKLSSHSTASGSRFVNAVVQLVHPCIATAMPINRFRGEFFFLSSFFPCRQGVEFEGDLYPTSEHAYQAGKIEDRDRRDSFTLGGSLGDNPMQKQRVKRSRSVQIGRVGKWT